jgi:hypothetical protein
MKGLSFCADMMLAWLSDKKTVTRRLMNPQPSEPCSHSYQHPTEKWWTFGDNTGRIWKPRYIPGETVYIKEAWHCDDPATAQDVMSRGEGLYYKATEVHPEIFPKWKPGMFMPEWASRSKALVVSVRPEKLHDITDDDAKKEGIDLEGIGGVCLGCHLIKDSLAIDRYARLWDSINAKKYPWPSNPWVWRYELKKLSGTLPINIDDFICDACGKVISDDDELIIGEDCKLHKRCADGLKT